MIKASLAVCILLAAAPSCPDLYSLATHGFTAPTIDQTTALAAPAPGGLLVYVSLTATNPNAYPINVAGIDYTVSVNGAPLFGGSESAVSVAENGTSTVQLSGIVPVRGFAGGQTVSYSISGTAHVDSPAGIPVDVEFEDQGTFVVPQGIP